MIDLTNHISAIITVANSNDYDDEFLKEKAVESLLRDFFGQAYELGYNDAIEEHVGWEE